MVCQLILKWHRNIWLPRRLKKKISRHAKHAGTLVEARLSLSGNKEKHTEQTQETNKIKQIQCMMHSQKQAQQITKL